MEWIFLAISIVFCLTQLILSWDKPILDQYAFRQTQTAISAYWIAKGGSWLAYATPTLGAPWSIPFEFPLYQWLVAGVASQNQSITLDQAGRLLSMCFFLACLWPAWRIATHYRHGRSMFRICAALTMLSPLYVFWSRAFMMESAALFFSIWFVAAVRDFLNKPNAFGFAEMIQTGSTAACIKITTFLGFSLAGALLVLYAMYVARKRISHTKALLVPYASIALSVLISIATLWIWVHYSDHIKSLNLIGQSLTSYSERMKSWNYGTLAQRESLDLWRVILIRAPNEAMGSWIVVPLVTIYALFRLPWRRINVFLFLVTLYITPFLVFTNLHLVHHYYQYANSIFLIAAIGFLISIASPGDYRPTLLVLTLMAAVEIHGYFRYFYADMMESNRELQTLLAIHIREHVPKGEMFVGFGLGWSSEVPYYAERRALMIPDSVTNRTLTALADNFAVPRRGPTVGAVVVCPNQLADRPETSKTYNYLLSLLIQNRWPHVVGYCVVYN